MMISLIETHRINIGKNNSYKYEVDIEKKSSMLSIICFKIIINEEWNLLYYVYF
jgi:hypothetical protein